MDISGKNRYELLFMDEDAVPIIEPSKDAAVAGKKKAADARIATAPRTTTTNKTEKENKSSILNKNKVSTANSGQKSVNTKIAATNGAKPDTRNRRPNTSDNNPTVPEYNNELPKRQFRDRDIKGPPSRFRNNEKFGKREFDRQSGSDKTGVKPIDKRDGAGAHNWGSAKQDIEDLKSGSTAGIADKDDSATEQQANGDAAAIVEEDDSKQMTLDEWKALKDQRAKPNYNLRKAGEGVDNAEWKKMIVLGKKKESNAEDEFEYDPSMYPQRVGRLQRITDIQFNFSDSRKTGFRKGVRGPPRGGPRAENGPNTGFEKTPSLKFPDKRRSAPGPKPLKVDDEHQFPTLS